MNQPKGRQTTVSESVDLYRTLLLVRRTEEAIVKLYPQNLMRTPMHMSMGQEFVPVGVCAALHGQADVFTSYRTHAPFLAQTRDTDALFAELHGRVDGTAEGKSGSMHLAAPDMGVMLSSGVVATQIPAAVGAAFANLRLGTQRTAVAFMGDGAVDTGVFWESVNAAALFKLPVLFVCEDNGFAVDTPRSARQAVVSLVDTVRSFGCDSYRDDSSDVECVYELTKLAVDKARRDRRPALLEIKCCRYLEHVGIGDDWHWGYRDKDQVQRDWIDRDAVVVQRKRLLSHGLAVSELQKIESEIDDQVAASAKRAVNSAVPAADRLYAGVFHEKP